MSFYIRLRLLPFLFALSLASQLIAIDWKDLAPNAQPALELPAWIDLRGFLYCTPEGEIILSSQPNLKSCCTHKVSAHQKIVLKTDKIGTSQLSVVKVRGLLKREMLTDQEGDLTQVYILEQVVIE